MTMTQIKYFITAAKFLNFSTAAEFMYVSQPALSHQISAIERELNIQLFIRGNRYVRLTPAGIILYKEFSNVYEAYVSGVEHAKNANKGLSGSVNIGILDGTYIGDFMPDMVEEFGQKYPALNISLYNYSFSELLAGIYNKSLDIVFTLEFNVKGKNELLYDVLEPTRDNIVLHRKHPLYSKRIIELKDFENEDFIVISDSDLSITSRCVIDEYKKAHVTPKIRYAPDLQTCMLWLEAGMGAAYIFSRSKLKLNPDLRFVEVKSPWKTAFVMAWLQNNYNTAIPLVGQFCRKAFNI